MVKQEDKREEEKGKERGEDSWRGMTRDSIYNKERVGLQVVMGKHSICNVWIRYHESRIWGFVIFFKTITRFYVSIH